MSKIVHLRDNAVGPAGVMAEVVELNPDAVVVCFRVGGKWNTAWATMMPEELSAALVKMHKDVLAVVE